MSIRSTKEMSNLINSEVNAVISACETMADLERRHKAEVRKLDGETRALLKSAKKSTRAQIEAQIIQMQYDLKAKHSEEIDAWEENGGNSTAENEAAAQAPEPELNLESSPTPEEIAAAKKAKAKRKQVGCLK